MPASQAQRQAQADYDAKKQAVEDSLANITAGIATARQDLLGEITACGDSFAAMERADLYEGNVRESTMEARHKAFWEWAYNVVGMASTLKN